MLLVFDELFDFLIANPDHFIGLHVGEGHIDLVVNDFLPFVGIHNGIDGALQHVIGSDFEAPFFHGRLRGIGLLVGPFPAHLFPLGTALHQPYPSTFDKSFFQLFGKDLRLDMFMGFVFDHAYDDDRLFAVVFTGVPAEPWLPHNFSDELCSGKAGVCIVPAPAQVYGSIGIDALNFAVAGGAQQQGEEQ